jgi:hypothetical protein
MAIVYILTNESMQGIIKIGITDNLQRRIKDLDNTSTPLPFECYYAVEVSDANSIEKLLHETFDDKRVRQNREFFNCNPEQAKSALQIAEKMGGIDVTPTDGIFENTTDKQALENAKKQKGKIDYFGILGIDEGEILTFSKDNEITGIYKGNNQILFRGELSSLSASALLILTEMGYDWKTVQGAGYWCFRGETLTKLYNQI